MNAGPLRDLTQNTELEERNDNSECPGDPKNLNEDRAWKVLNQTLLNVWVNLDDAAKSLTAFFGSIMKTPMQFIKFVVPQCRCCNLHFLKKANECLAFDTWLLGRMLCVLGREKLAGVHEAALEAQIQILNLLLATHPPLYMNIITCYLQCMQDLMEVERGKVTQFPFLLRRFIPQVETFRDLELNLKPSFVHLHNVTESEQLLAYLMKVLQSTASGLKRLQHDVQQQLWSSICFLLSEGPCSLQAEALTLASCLIKGGSLPPTLDSQIVYWRELWYYVQILLTSSTIDSVDREYQQELINSLKALLSATCHHMYFVGPRERDVLLSTVFTIMQNQLNASLCDNIQDKVSQFARQVLEGSMKWQLDKCSPHTIIDNFNAYSRHTLPVLKHFILHELQLHVSLVKSLYQSKHQNLSPDYNALNHSPSVAVSMLDVSPSWRQLWKHVLLASNKLNQDTIAAGCVLQELQVCKCILELSIELTAELQNLQLSKSCVSIVHFTYFGDQLTELATSVISAVHQCRPSKCADTSKKVLEEALKVLGAVASLPESQEGVDLAEAVLSLPWLDAGTNSFQLDSDHVLFKVMQEYQPCLDMDIKKLCLSQLCLVSSVKHASWRRKIVEQCVAVSDLCPAAVPVIPWLLHNLQHPVPSSELMPLLSPVFQSSDLNVQLILAKSLCSIVCSLSGKCICVWTMTEGKVERKLLCLLCHSENWLNSPFPYTGSLEGQLLCLNHLLQSEHVEVRRAVTRALPTLAGHLSKFRRCCDLTSWMPFLLDTDREVRIEFAKHARWLVFDGCWIRDKEQVSKETGCEFIPLSQLDRHELSTSEPLLARFCDYLVDAARCVLKKYDDPRQESLVIVVSNIGCIALDCVLLPSLTQLLILAGHWRSSHAGLVQRCIRDIAHAHNVTAKDLFNRFKPELCKNMVLTAAWCHVGENGFVNTLTTLARQFDFEDARELVLKEKEMLLPPLIAVVLGRSSIQHILQQVAADTGVPLKDLLQSAFQHIYPHIVINHSEELLSQFIDFFKNECEIDDLNTFLAPFLKIIHNELLLHFEGHRDRVLKTLQWLAQVDPTYKNPIASPLSEEEIADFLQPRFLGVLTHLESCLTSETAAESIKVHALRSVPELIRLMGPRHISLVRFKVLATLRIALRLNHANFPHLTIAAWNAFVHSLDDTSLGPLLSTVFASLLPLLETYPKEVASVFNYIVIEKRQDLCTYFKELYFIPAHPALTDIVTAIEGFSKTQSSKNGMYIKIKEKLQYVAHDNVDVRLHALQFLTELLNKSHKQLNEAIVKQEHVEPCIIEMLNKLTEACRDPDERVKFAAAECLGKIGAVDPGILPNQKSLSGLNFFASDVDNHEFAIQALSQLAKGFQDATDMRTVDAFSLSIQDLLKVYGVTSNGSLWKSFAPNVQDIMRPLLKSSYKSRFKLTASAVTPVYGSELGTNLQEWVTNWSMKLIADMAEDCPRRVFESCVLAFMRDIGTVLFFLPYILLHALTGAQDPHRTHEEILKEFQALIDITELSELDNLDYEELPDTVQSWPRVQEELKREQCILAVHGRAASAAAARVKDASLRFGSLSGSSSSEALHAVYMVDQIRCLRTAFQLLDYLWQWVRTTRMNNKKEVLIDNNAAFGSVQGFLKRLCKLTIAQRNFECKEYARALVYLEQYVKENPDELQNQLCFLEELYVHLDDPDAVAGTLAIQGKEPSLKQLARAHEVTGQYQNAAACYEEMAQDQLLDPEQVQGMVRCYLSLDQPFTALKIAEGVVTDRPEVAQDVHEQYAECLWRLHKFDELENFIASPSLANNTSWGVQIGRALLLLRQAEHSKLSAVLDSTLHAIVEHLSAMDRQHGVYFHGYDYIVKLHVLYELKRASETLASVLELSDTGADSATHIVSNLLDEWENRIQIVKRAAGALEPILCLRRIILEQAHSRLQNCDAESANLLTHEIGKCWLQSAKAARKEGYYQQAFIYILNAQKYKPPALFVEKARLYWEKGDKQSAFSTLNRGLEEQFPDAIKFKDMTDQRDKRLLCAKARLLIAQYNEQRLKVDSEESKEQYTLAVHACQQWERPLVELARFYDRKFQSLPDSEKDAAHGAEMQIVMVTYLGRSLLYGTKYIYQSMPRMLTLWLDYGNNNPDHRDVIPDIDVTTKKLTELIKIYSDSLPQYLFYTAFSQLVSRICHQNNMVLEQLRIIILKIVIAYPKQALWMLMGSLKSCYVVRAKRCQEILQHSEIRKKDLSQLVSDYNALTDRLIDLTNATVKSDNITISSLSPRLPTMLKSPNFSEVVVPVDRYMKFVLPTSDVSKNHEAFPQKLVYLQNVKENVMVLHSLQKPRKITFIGSDGLTYDIMCKPKDDLRKDFRMMEFNAVVNRLLHRDPQSRQRELHIRTYSVVPLNEECGMVEWVSNLVCLRPLLSDMYRQIGVRYDNNKMKEMLTLRNDPSKYRQEFTKLYKAHPPILSEWFFTTFPDTASWYLARTSYVRTCAVMSMVGYIVGLGDRHGENILLDKCTGEVVHVDFNCLFNKGDNFEWPEIVPFRLTQNMVDAMGPLGTEGPFRRTCEVTLDVLRAQSDTLMSILRPFLYDPLISWKRPGGRRPQGEMTNESAVQNLNRIERRLQGMVRGAGKVYAISLSAEGQANSLILEATKFENLCRMYIGWGPHL